MRAVRSALTSTKPLPRWVGPALLLGSMILGYGLAALAVITHR